MSNKKSLLTESEVRRFMTLANIPAVGSLKENQVGYTTSQDPDNNPKKSLPPAQENYMVPEEEQEEYEEGMESYGEGQEDENLQISLEEAEEEEESEEEEEEGEEEESMEEPAEEEGSDDMGDMEAGGGDLGLSPEQQKGVVEAFLSALGIDADVSGDDDAAAQVDAAASDEEGSEEMPAPPEGEEGGDAMMQESLVDTVLARVSARLVAEAKKKKGEEKKKKMTAAEKMKMLKKKKKALDEANAPAPKSSMSNASKAGVAKGHGPGKKEFGTSDGEDQEFSEKKTKKGGHEYSTMTASQDHTLRKGKNLATLGGNKKKG